MTNVVGRFDKNGASVVHASCLEVYHRNANAITKVEQVSVRRASVCADKRRHYMRVPSQRSNKLPDLQQQFVTEVHVVVLQA